ncbi:MAG: M17 family peptidase N-terminal domain-containing protein, partial [Desulfobacterales bacterium]
MLKMTSIDLNKSKIETLAIAVCEDGNIHAEPLIDAVVGKALKLKEFKGEKDETVVFYDLPDIKVKRVILWGLGKLEKINREALRSMAGKTVKYCINKKLTSLCFAVPDPTLTKMKLPVLLEAMQEGAYLGNHLFHKFKGEAKKRALKQIHFRVNKQISP